MIGQVISGWDKGVATMLQGETCELVCTAPYAYGSTGSPPTIPPDATLHFEVELLRWDGVKDLFKDGGVIKTIIKDGIGYKRPQKHATVFVNFTVKLQDGTVIDSRKDFEFILGETKMLPAIVKAVENMKKGEIAEVLVEPKYGYAGAKEVPAPNGLNDLNATLSIELELLNWVEIMELAPNGDVIKRTVVEGRDTYESPEDDASVTGKLFRLSVALR